MVDTFFRILEEKVSIFFTLFTVYCTYYYTYLFVTYLFYLQSVLCDNAVVTRIDDQRGMTMMTNVKLWHRK